MYDIMVDLETMCNSPSAAICSIGAIECNLITGETGEEFYRVVDLNNQKNTSIDPNTIYWWLKQNKLAREALTIHNKISLFETCNTFSSWVGYLKAPNDKIRLWGNGASFDNAILRYAFKQYKLEFPIEFWNDRDMRTIVGFYPEQLQNKWRQDNIRSGTHHNALADAKYQVKYCSNILTELGVEKLY